jgi:hypothetical protein
MSDAPEITDETLTDQVDGEAAGEDAEDPVELEALAMGWKPQSQFKGPAEKFVSAADYVERGKTIMPFLRKELAGAYKKIEGLEKAVQSAVSHISKADQRAYAKARADLDAELEAAATAGNAADVKAITQEIVDLQVGVAAKPGEAEGNPDFAAWQEENDWYAKDKSLAAAFDALCRDVFEDGYTKPKAGLKEATARLKAEFPDKFAKAENPNRRLPGTVEGGSAPRRPGGKTYSDLPPEAKAMCDDFVKRVPGFTKDRYVKDYFA